MSLLRLALRNVLRKPGRATVTVVALAVALTAFILLRTTVAAWHGTYERAAEDRLGTRNRVSFTLVLPRAYADEVRALPGVREASFANWFAGRDPRRPKTVFTSLAVDAPSYLAVYDEIALEPAARARWLGSREGAIIGDTLARTLGVRVGDTLVLDGTVYPGRWSVRIEGVFSTTRESPVRSQLLLHWSRLDEAIPAWRRGRLGWIVTRPAAGTSAAALARAIDERFAGRNVRTLTMSERAINRSFLGLLASVLGALDAVSVVILAVVALLCGNALAMGVRERGSEYGILRTLGFRGPALGLLLGAEGALLGAAGGALAVVLSVVLVHHVLGGYVEAQLSGLFPYFRVAPSSAFGALAIGVVLGAGTSLLSLGRLLRGSCAVQLRGGGR